MLDKYRKKRDFKNTPEPTGNSIDAGDKLRFVVQKHQASRLHYDFRLELNGVLKSWAIPKGPSLNPEDKHLAVMVEDHPYDYREFEGVIPKGNYGAGTVMIWDEGFYHSFEGTKEGDENLLSKGLKDGHLTFILEGKKLRGEFALIKLKKAEEDSWLLIKAAKDEFAGNIDILKQDYSAKTGRTMEEIAEESVKEGDVWSSKIDLSQIRPLLEKSKKTKLPENIKPMMSTLKKEAFDDKDWSFEIKWDGYRAITQIKNGKVRMYSRNNKDFNLKFPEIVNAFQSFDKDVVFDGEVVAVDKNGKPGFQMLQDYFLNKRGNLIYYIFDCLYFDGYDLSNLALEERRKILSEIIPKVPNIQISEDVKELGKEFFEAAKKEDLEGIMAKRIDSTYQSGGRSRDWLKIKNHMEQEVVIGGYTLPRGSRQDFGSIAAGVYQGDKLVYIGNVGSGFNEELLKILHERFKQLKQKASPFVNPPEIKGITWLEPKMVAEVKFQEWTAEGSMRQPVFLGIREDKNPKEVIKEI